MLWEQVNAEEVLGVEVRLGLLASRAGGG